MNRFAAYLRALAPLGLFLAVFQYGQPLHSVGASSIKLMGTTRMFRIEWGEGPGQFHYQESELGFEGDTFPRKFVRDHDGDFYFLEPGPPARFSKFSSDGHLMNLLELPKVFASLTPRDVITPQELFLRPDGNIAALLRVYLNVEKREEIYLVYFNPTGTQKNLVQFPHFKFASFNSDNDSFLDKDGYLWVLKDGGVCDVYGPTGELLRSLKLSGSFVDSDGHLYSGFSPLKLFGRMGENARELGYEGHSVSEEPDSLQGANGTDLLFSWKHVDKVRQGDLTMSPRILDLYRPVSRYRKLEYIGEATLPPSKSRRSNPRSDYSERTEIYENRLVFDEAGNIYFMGRSPKECWIEKVQLEIK